VRALAPGLAALALAVPAAGAETPPPVVASSLQEGQSLSGKVAWEALASGAPLARVEFVVDGWLRHVEREAPYVYDWDTARELDGVHTLELWAVAEDGRVATQTVRVAVRNSFSLSFADVADGDIVRGTVPWHARVEGIAPEWVEFLVDGKLAFTESDPPYGRRFDTAELSNGRHRLTLWAVGTNGHVATTTVDVVVRNAVPEVAPGRVADRLRRETWYWEDLMQRPRTPAVGSLASWQRRAAATRRRASRPPHWREFLCIHRYEGSWTASTGNGYFGGLQMNLVFQQSYGPELFRRKGTANRWTPLEQIWVAERAWRVRGFRPWPQTARMCGLL